MKTILKNAFWIAAALCLLLAVLLTVSVRRQSAELAGRVVRLHVVAASDEAADQAVKLEVRDAVLELLTPRLAGCESLEEAGRTLSASLGEIKAEARRVCGRDVAVTLGKERFPTRVYETFALPAGEYESLRVTIGEGEGHNWWCVVFPPLCDPERAGEAFAALGDGASLAGDGVVLKFRFVEWLEKLAGRISAAKAR